MNCLPLEDIKLFYDIHFSLLGYTNSTCQIVDTPNGFPSPGHVLRDDLNRVIVPVRKYLFTHPEIVEDFIQKNPRGFSAQELEIVKGWGQAMMDQFIVYKHLKNYSLFLLEKNKQLFAVLGLKDPLLEILPKQSLPTMIQTVIIPFRDKIVYDGLLSIYNVSFGPGMRSSLKETTEMIEARQGVILGFSNGQPIREVSDLSPDQRMIKFYLKSESNRNYYWDEAWALAQKSKENRIFYKKELGKVYARSIKRDLKENGLTGFHYAIYDQLVVGVGKSKKEVEAFCRKNLPDLIDYLYFFKV